MKAGEKMMVCRACADYLCSDMDSLEYYYPDEKERQEVINRIEAALTDYEGQDFHLFFDENGELEVDEFSKSPCELCGSNLAGMRVAVVPLRLE